MHIFNISLAPNQKYFSFLGFFGDSHSHSVYRDGRIVCNFGFVFLLIISLLGELGVFFLIKKSFFFANFSLNFTLLCSLGLEPVSCHKYTSL